MKWFLARKDLQEEVIFKLTPLKDELELGDEREEYSGLRGQL